MNTHRHSAKQTDRKSPVSMNASHAALAEEVLFQPWFLPQGAAVAIHSLVPVDYWKKMLHFFEDYGCMKCGTEFDYHSNGMCRLCRERTRKKLLLSVKRHAGRGKRRRLDLELFRQEKLAKKLLARLSARGPAKPKRPHLGLASRSNPVYEAFASRFE